MDNFDLTEIDRTKLQDSLVLLRSIAGWNAQEFSSFIGVTRQYYSEIENNSRKLTQSLSLAILYVYEKEATRNNDLKNVLNSVLDKNALTIEQCKSLSNYISNERKKKTMELNATKIVYGILGAAAVTLGSIIVKAIIRK